MDRKEYLERMRRAAVIMRRPYAGAEELNGATVYFRGMTLYPVAYQLSYEADGETVRHTAVMQSRDQNHLYYGRLSGVEAPPPDPAAPA